jgi:hypothetical protein
LIATTATRATVWLEHTGDSADRRSSLDPSGTLLKMSRNFNIK